MNDYDFLFSGAQWMLAQHGHKPVDVYTGLTRDEALKRAIIRVQAHESTLNIYTADGKLEEKRVLAAARAQPDGQNSAKAGHE